MKMMKMLKLIILGIFSLTQGALAKGPANYFQLNSLISELTQAELIKWVNELVTVSAPSRMVGQPGHAQARSYIEAQVKKLDIKSRGTITQQTFTPEVELALHQAQLARRLHTTPGVNIIWEKRGISDKQLIITTHYDTFSEKAGPMPGANYNATGVAVALGLIRLLAPLDLNYGVQVVFLDWQGPGLLGSLHHAKTLPAQHILGVVNLERLGQDTTYFDRQKKLGNMSVYVSGAKAEWLTTFLQHGAKLTKRVQFELKAKQLPQSDSRRYAEQGLKVATFSQNLEDDFNPKFHQTPEDTPETLNHSTFYHSYLFISGVVLGTLLDISK
jgi:Zn-dependent M28 family amino/carboxypeptidase